MADLEGHFLIGFGDGTGAGSVRLLPEAHRPSRWPSRRPSCHAANAYARVERLIDGFETPYGLELLATTHWVAAHEGASNPGAAAELIRAWSPRKEHLFTDEHVEIAWTRLDEGGWLTHSLALAGR